MKPSMIFVEKEVAAYPQTASIISAMKAPHRIIDTPREAFDAIAAAPDPIKQGKEMLLLSRNRGAFIKDCPGTREYKCCGYKILHTASFCNMDCAYCILQVYFHPPVLQFFINYDDMFREIDAFFQEKQISRIGTGEFTDSLIWPEGMDQSKQLVEVFSKQTSKVLELKTKTVAVEALRGRYHNRKTILSWSLNTEKVIHSEERHTATLSARLKAAARCESWGYPVSFHFDPIVLYDGCEADYKAVVRQIFQYVSPENIVWISLGTFRYIPALKTIIQKRFPDSKIVYGEFIPGLDGKMRYFKPLRMQIYKKMVAWIREYAPDVCVYFCMEDDDIWENCIGFAPSEPDGLSDMLNRAAAAHCGLSL